MGAKKYPDDLAVNVTNSFIKGYDIHAINKYYGKKFATGTTAYGLFLRVVGFTMDYMKANGIKMHNLGNASFDKDGEPVLVDHTIDLIYHRKQYDSGKRVPHSIKNPSPYSTAMEEHIEQTTKELQAAEHELKNLEKVFNEAALTVSVLKGTLSKLQDIQGKL